MASKYQEDFLASLHDQAAAQGITLPGMQPGTAPLMRDPGTPVVTPDFQPQVLPSGPAVKHSPGIDPGVALANAGFTKMPEGVGAPLPPPPPVESAALKGSPSAEGAVFAQPAGAGAARPAMGGGHAAPSPFAADRNAIGEAYKAEHAAAADTAAAEKSALEAKSVGQGLVSQHEDETAAKMDAERAKAEQAYADRQKQYDAFSKEAADKSKINPDHWAQNASTGQKIALILASALGGWSSSKTGGPNVGLAAINSEIDKDISAQRAAIEGRSKRLEDMKVPLAEALQRTKSMPEAVAMLRAQALKGVMARNATLADGAQSEKVNAQASTLNAQLQKQEAEEKLQYDQAAARAAAAGAKGPDQKELLHQFHQLSEDREKAGIPAIKETAAELDQMIKSHPEGLPGSSIGSRIASHIPLVGQAMIGSEARRADGLISSFAEAAAHANGQRGLEAIEYNKQMIRGNGSAEDVRKGIAWATRQVNARQAEINAGFDPDVVQAHDELANTYKPAPTKVIPKTLIK